MNGLLSIAVFLLTSCRGTDAGSSVPMADKQATAETRALYLNLKKMQGHGTMFGHQDATAYGIGWENEPDRSDVKSVVNDYPAVYGWELGGIERETLCSLDSVEFLNIRRLIIEAYGRGGVNTVSWHADNIVTGGDSWDVAGDSVVSSILPGGKNHEVYKKRLDLLAGFFHSLKAEDGTAVPVLFRPFHEHTGNWFWWGKDFCSVEDYVALWHFTVDYLSGEKGLHNLIYAYSPDRVESEEQYMERYPGDEYVDILGLDLYHFNGEEGVEYYRQCASTSLGVAKNLSVTKNKPFAFTETGLEGVTMSNWFTEVLYPMVANYKPAYVLVWRNAVSKPGHFYAPYPGHPACADFVKFKDKEDLLFGSEVPAMYRK